MKTEQDRRLHNRYGVHLYQHAVLITAMSTVMVAAQGYIPPNLSGIIVNFCRDVFGNVTAPTDPNASGTFSGNNTNSFASLQHNGGLLHRGDSDGWWGPVDSGFSLAVEPREQLDEDGQQGSSGGSYYSSLYGGLQQYGEKSGMEIEVFETDASGRVHVVYKDGKPEEPEEPEEPAMLSMSARKMAMLSGEDRESIEAMQQEAEEQYYASEEYAAYEAAHAKWEEEVAEWEERAIGPAPEAEAPEQPAVLTMSYRNLERLSGLDRASIEESLEEAEEAYYASEEYAQYESQMNAYQEAQEELRDRPQRMYLVYDPATETSFMATDLMVGEDGELVVISEVLDAQATALDERNGPSNSTHLAHFRHFLMKEGMSSEEADALVEARMRSTGTTLTSAYLDEQTDAVDEAVGLVNASVEGIFSDATFASAFERMQAMSDEEFAELVGTMQVINEGMAIALEYEWVGMKEGLLQILAFFGLDENATPDEVAAVQLLVASLPGQIFEMAGVNNLEEFAELDENQLEALAQAIAERGLTSESSEFELSKDQADQVLGMLRMVLSEVSHADSEPLQDEELELALTALFGAYGEDGADKSVLSGTAELWAFLDENQLEGGHRDALRIKVFMGGADMAYAKLSEAERSELTEEEFKHIRGLRGTYNDLQTARNRYLNVGLGALTLADDNTTYEQNAQTLINLMDDDETVSGDSAFNELVGQIAIASGHVPGVNAELDRRVNAAISAQLRTAMANYEDDGTDFADKRLINEIRTIRQNAGALADQVAQNFSLELGGELGEEYITAAEAHAEDVQTLRGEGSLFSALDSEEGAALASEILNGAGAILKGERAFITALSVQRLSNATEAEIEMAEAAAVAFQAEFDSMVDAAIEERIVHTGISYADDYQREQVRDEVIAELTPQIEQLQTQLLKEAYLEGTADERFIAEIDSYVNPIVEERFQERVAELSSDPSNFYGSGSNIAAIRDEIREEAIAEVLVSLAPQYSPLLEQKVEGAQLVQEEISSFVSEYGGLLIGRDYLETELTGTESFSEAMATYTALDSAFAMSSQYTQLSEFYGDVYSTRYGDELMSWMVADTTQVQSNMLQLMLMATNFQMLHNFNIGAQSLLDAHLGLQNQLTGVNNPFGSYLFLSQSQMRDFNQQNQSALRGAAQGSLLQNAYETYKFRDAVERDMYSALIDKSMEVFISEEAQHKSLGSGVPYYVNEYLVNEERAVGLSARSAGVNAMGEINALYSDFEEENGSFLAASQGELGLLQTRLQNPGISEGLNLGFNLVKAQEIGSIDQRGRYFQQAYGGAAEREAVSDRINNAVNDYYAETADSRQDAAPAGTQTASATSETSQPTIQASGIMNDTNKIEATGPIQTIVPGSLSAAIDEPVNSIDIEKQEQIQIGEDRFDTGLKGAGVVTTLTDQIRGTTETGTLLSLDLISNEFAVEVLSGDEFSQGVRDFSEGQGAEIALVGMEAMIPAIRFDKRDADSELRQQAMAQVDGISERAFYESAELDSNNPEHVAAVHAWGDRAYGNARTNATAVINAVEPVIGETTLFDKSTRQLTGMYMENESAFTDQSLSFYNNILQTSSLEGFGLTLHSNYGSVGQQLSAFDAFITSAERPGYESDPNMRLASADLGSADILVDADSGMEYVNPEVLASQNEGKVYQGAVVGAMNEVVDGANSGLLLTRAVSGMLQGQAEQQNDPTAANLWASDPEDLQALYVDQMDNMVNIQEGFYGSHMVIVGQGMADSYKGALTQFGKDAGQANHQLYEYFKSEFADIRGQGELGLLNDVDAVRETVIGAVSQTVRVDAAQMQEYAAKGYDLESPGDAGGAEVSVMTLARVENAINWAPLLESQGGYAGSNRMPTLEQEMGASDSTMQFASAMIDFVYANANNAAYSSVYEAYKAELEANGIDLSGGIEAAKNQLQILPNARVDNIVSSVPLDMLNSGLAGAGAGGSVPSPGP